MTIAPFFKAVYNKSLRGFALTINQYLYALEQLRNRRDKAFEKYIRAHERAAAPTAAHINTDGITNRSGSNGTEDKLIKAAEAWAKFERASTLYFGYEKQLNRNLDKLQKLYGWQERAALELIYIENQGRPYETRRGGLCRVLGVRTKAEAGEVVRAAKEHLTEILIAQGVPIEK